MTTHEDDEAVGSPTPNDEVADAEQVEASEVPRAQDEGASGIAGLSDEQRAELNRIVRRRFIIALIAGLILMVAAFFLGRFIVGHSPEGDASATRVDTARELAVGQVGHVVQRDLAVS